MPIDTNKPNQAIIGTLFTALRFGMASPFCAKTPLRKKCPI